MNGPTLVRPKSRLHALRAAETLGRSGGFALVVLAGTDPQGTENVRLSRAAHDGGGAVIAITDSASTAGLRVLSRIQPHSYVWRRTPHGDPAACDAATLQVHAMSLGWNRRGRVVLPVLRDELRAAIDATLPDRRGGVRVVRRSSIVS